MKKLGTTYWLIKVDENKNNVQEVNQKIADVLRNYKTTAYIETGETPAELEKVFHRFEAEDKARKRSIYWQGTEKEDNN